MASNDQNPVLGTGEEMLPKSGNPFADLEDAQGRLSWSIALSKEEQLLIEEERVRDLETLDPARATRLPPDWEALDLPATPEETEPRQMSPEGDISRTMPAPAADLGEAAAPPIQEGLVETEISVLLEKLEALQEEIELRDKNLLLSKELLEQIQSGRRLAEQGPPYLEEAQQLAKEVELALSISEQVEKWARGNGRLIFVYLVFVTLIFSGATWAAGQYMEPGILLHGLTGALIAGIGTALSSLNLLRKQMAQEPGSSQRERSWYFTQPVFGTVLGVFVYMVSLVLIQISTGQQGAMQNPLFMYLLAFLAGFGQNHFSQFFPNRSPSTRLPSRR